MSSGIEPIPIQFPLGPPEGRTDTALMLKEAFRQGWEAARRWPNHPAPTHVFITLEQGPTKMEALLRIEWP